jgi:hypothetical protein
MISMTASSLLIAAMMTGGSVGASTADAPVLIATAVTAAPAPVVVVHSLRAAPAPEAWTVDRPASGRPKALPAMYAALGAMQAFDVYSTRRALTSGAVEANPLMRGAAKSSGTMLAVKALSTAGTILIAERMWKKNRTGAVILLAVVNGATAAVAVRNMRNAK